MSQNKLYVGNLTFSTDDAGLAQIFSEIGNVTSASVVTDRETGRSRGFAFVTMASSAGAQKAIAKMNSAVVDGRPLRVNEAEERKNGGGGGGGGGGGAPRRGGHRGW